MSIKGLDRLTVGSSSKLAEPRRRVTPSSWEATCPVGLLRESAFGVCEETGLKKLVILPLATDFVALLPRDDMTTGTFLDLDIPSCGGKCSGGEEKEPKPDETRSSGLKG